MKTSITLLCLLLLNFSKSLGQTREDTAVTSEGSYHYEFHPNLNPQEGYGLIFGVHGGLKNEEPRRMIYEIGVAKTTMGHEGLIERYVCVEINDIRNELLYGFIAGVAAKEFLDFGVSLNYMTNFSGARTLSIRPSMGFLFLPPVRSLYCEIGCDLSLVKPNFDILDHWIIGIQFNLGMLERKKDGAQQP